MIVYVTRKQALDLIDKAIARSFGDDNAFHPEDMFGMIQHVSTIIEIALTENGGSAQWQDKQ